MKRWKAVCTEWMNEYKRGEISLWECICEEKKLVQVGNCCNTTTLQLHIWSCRYYRVYERFVSFFFSNNRTHTNTFSMFFSGLLLGFFFSFSTATHSCTSQYILKYENRLITMAEKPFESLYYVRHVLHIGVCVCVCLFSSFIFLFNSNLTRCLFMTIKTMI